MTIQRWFGCFLVVVAAVSLVGCGSDSGGSTGAPLAVQSAAGT